MAAIDTIVMDKTGTITDSDHNSVKTKAALTEEQKALVYSACINSIHPLCRMIYHYLGGENRLPVSAYSEIAGKGILATIGMHKLRIGSTELVPGCLEETVQGTNVHLMIDGNYLGFFGFAHSYREGLENISALEPSYRLFLLSGDNDHGTD